MEELAEAVSTSIHVGCASNCRPWPDLKKKSLSRSNIQCHYALIALYVNFSNTLEFFDAGNKFLKLHRIQLDTNL